MGVLSLLGTGSGGASGPPFSPSDIAGMVAWFDASDAASITSSAGAVSQWNDKSGNARHATQATAGKKPLTGTRTVNGLNVIDFDGVDDALATPAVTQAQPLSVCAVLVSDLPADVPQHQALGDPASEGPTLYTQTNGHWWYYAQTPEADSGIVALSSAQCLQVLFNGASSTIRADGILASVATGTFGWSAQAIPLSGNGVNAAFWNGAIAELIIYGGDKTANFAQLRTYLQGKWGTP